MRIGNRRFTLAVAGAMVLMFSAPAFAYLDPGSGSVLLQGILAALAAIAVTAKLYWHRLLRLLGLKRQSAEDPSEARSENQNRSTASESAEENHQ